jgi:hypothetical protein
MSLRVQKISRRERLAVFITPIKSCNNKDTGTNDVSLQEENSSGAKSGEYAEIGSGSHLVKFPEVLEEGIVFATYDRGDIHEDIYVNSKDAIEAAQNGEEFPSGTVITLVGYSFKGFYIILWTGFPTLVNKASA